jgi:hypothetical protein
MPFEKVTIVLRDGRQHAGVDWATVRQWVHDRRLPTNAALIDEGSGEQRSVGSFPELAALASSAGGGGDVGSTIIPYKNPPALTSYYLGIFSLFSCLPLVGFIGVAMGIAALVLGIKGLKRVRANPECKGTAHAWIGVVLGAISGVLGLAWNIFFVVGIVMSNR